MKTKTSLIVTAASLALFSAANGQTIDIAGSTAGRSTVHAEILNRLFNETVRFYRVNGATTTAASADGAIYKGNLGSAGGPEVVVRTFWSGSAAGVDAVSNQVQLDNKFIEKSVIDAAHTATPGTSSQLAGTAVALAASLDDADAGTTAEFGYSDVKQAATPYQSTPLAEEVDMFVIPFKFMKTATLTGVTNITDQQARVHFTAGGETPKSLFTGNAADAATIVYAVGRDNDSGTRISYAAETGAGVFTLLSQWSFTVGNNGTPADATDDVLTAPTAVFDGGYASGGSVASVLGATGYSAIGYIGLSDATTALANGGVELTFNGVAYSADAVKNGSYTYWSKYQSLLSSATTDANALSLYGSLKTALLALPTGSSSIKLSDMAVDRQADGGDVLY